jgi:hypothetical protein
VKKTLGFILLIVLYAGNVNANCKSEGLDWSWYINNAKTAAYFDFSNTTGKNFYINKLVLYSTSNEIVANRGTRIHIKPYGKFNTEGSYGISLRDINIQYIATGSIYCEVTTAAKANKKKNAGYNLGTKKKSGFEWWYLLFIPIVLAVIGGISEQVDKSKTEKKKNKGTHLGIKKGSTEGNVIGIVIVVAFIAVCIILIIKSNNF